jgi:ABC-type dipeptide/oligopeptide/nickel transport system permease subunit
VTTVGGQGGLALVLQRWRRPAGGTEREPPPAARKAPGAFGAVGRAGLVLVGLTALAGLAAPIIAPSGYDDQDLGHALRPPVWAGGEWGAPLGTDQLGRDVLSRLLHGARTSVLLCVPAVLVAGALGVLLGLGSGYVGGRLDAVVMGVVEIQLSFPYLLLAIAFMALLQPSLTNLFAVLVLRSWVTYARLTRVSVLSLAQREFVLLARAMGATDRRVLFRHIAPNVLTPSIVVSSFQFAELIVVESSLSFLGLGVQPPTPSWGSMLSQGREYIFTAWWLVALPGVAIVLIVLGANLLGDALRDVLDPRTRSVAGRRVRLARRRMGRLATAESSAARPGGPRS